MSDGIFEAFACDLRELTTGNRIISSIVVNFSGALAYVLPTKPGPTLEVQGF